MPENPVLVTILNFKIQIFTMGKNSSLGEPEEWEKAERKMIQQITSTRAKSVAYFEARTKNEKEKCGRNVIFTLKSAMYTILAVCYMQRQSRCRKEQYDHFEDSENKIESYRTRKKATKGRTVRMLMKIPKQDPLSWTTIQPSKTGAQENKSNISNLGLLHP